MGLWPLGGLPSGPSREPRVPRAQRDSPPASPGAARESRALRSLQAVGLQDLARRGLKRLQQAPSVWAAGPARVGSSGLEREVTQCHSVLRSSTLKLSVSHTARATLFIPAAPPASFLQHQAKGIFHDSPAPKYMYFSTLGKKKSSPNTHCIFIISPRYTGEHLALRGVHTSSTKY